MLFYTQLLSTFNLFELTLNEPFINVTAIGLNITNGNNILFSAVFSSDQSVLAMSVGNDTGNGISWKLIQVHLDFKISNSFDTKGGVYPVIPGASEGIEGFFLFPSISDLSLSSFNFKSWQLGNSIAIPSAHDFSTGIGFTRSGNSSFLLSYNINQSQSYALLTEILLDPSGAVFPKLVDQVPSSSSGPQISSTPNCLVTISANNILRYNIQD
jgi:hypothetical protein